MTQAITVFSEIESYLEEEEWKTLVAN
jgi:hypothetical protein